MTAENQNIVVIPGDSRHINFRIQDKDNALQPLNLAGAELTWTAYRSPHSQELFSKSASIVDAEGGIARVVLTPDDTNLFRFGSQYIHSLRVKDNLNQVSTVTRGKVNVE